MQNVSPSRPARALRPTLVALACAFALGACTSNDDDAPDPTPGGSERYAFVSGALGQSGQIERLELGDDIVASGTTPATTSDIRVATDGSDVYEIGRFQLDSLTRFRADELDAPVWQYSVESLSNPYEVVVASATKAYVIRYGSGSVWIVDPSAATEAEFKIGEIDLSAYDADGVPNASDAVLVDGRLYVLMQRLGGAIGFTPIEDGYVAVIDTASDTEIDTDPANDGLPGIALGTSNPERLLYPEGSDVVYVVGRGNIFANPDVTTDPYDGGIETIDTASFERSLLLDDGTTDEDPDDGVATNEGFFTDALVVSPTKGYVLTYSAFGVTTLRSFDPITGTLADGAVAGLEDRDISVLALGPDGHVWVGLNAPEDMEGGRGFLLLDPSDDSVVNELVPTEFNPNDIAFVAVADAG